MPPIVFKREPSYLKKHEAFPFQWEAVKAIENHEYAAIFHEQGLGKTKIAIDLMFSWFENKSIDTVLLVVKKGLIQNWLREFRIHTHMTPKLLTSNRRSNFYVFNTPSRVVLTHFEMIKSELSRIKLFLKVRKIGLIIDESAKIKNPTSNLTQTFFEIAPLCAKRIIMTGTPIANRPYDIWAQIYFLDQGKSLGKDFDEFKRQLNLSNELYRNEVAKDTFENELDLIHNKISSFAVRETKNSGIINLPKKIIKRIKTQWETTQRELYKQIEEEEKAIIVREGIPIEDNAENILKRMLRLIQVASNPLLIDQSYTVNPGKFLDLEEIIRDIIIKNEKCIVWTSFIKIADWLKKELDAYGSLKIHGKMAMDERNASIVKFTEDNKYKVLVATPGSAKEGLTLTVANHVIFYDRSFSLDDYLQAQDRIHRISQEETCYVYNLIMEDSIDEWVDILLQSKELAAKLGQGDISKDYFTSQISYEYGEIIEKILNIK